MEDALARISEDTPDAVLVDIGLPGMSGIEGIRVLKERLSDITLLAFTVYDDDENIFDALCVGASGYLLKNTPPTRLLEGLREVVTGGAPMSPEVARKVIRLFREVRPPAKPAPLHWYKPVPGPHASLRAFLLGRRQSSRQASPP